MVIVAVEILFINALEYVLFDELHSEKITVQKYFWHLSEI